MWIDTQGEGWKERFRFGAVDMSNTYAAVNSVTMLQTSLVVDSFLAEAASTC